MPVHDQVFLRRLTLATCTIVIVFVGHTLAFNFAPEIFPLTRFPMYSFLHPATCYPVLVPELRVVGQSGAQYKARVDSFVGIVDYNNSVSHRVMERALAGDPIYVDYVRSTLERRVGEPVAQVDVWLTSYGSDLNSYLQTRQQPPADEIHIGQIIPAVQHERVAIQSDGCVQPFLLPGVTQDAGSLPVAE